MRNKMPPTSTQQVNADRLNDFIEPKNSEFKNALNNIKLSVLAAYQNYEDNINNLSALRPIGYTGINKRALISCYSHKTDLLLEVKAEITPPQYSLDFLYCPYCQIGHSKQYDHYLAKSLFSEFSVFPKNLIFVCKDCNEEKGNECFKENRVFNPYFDPVPPEQFIFCDLECDNLAVKFYLERHENMSEEQFTLFDAHFHNLNLQERFMMECTKKLGEFIGAWKARIKVGQSKMVIITEARSELQSHIDYLEPIHGVNYYYSVFLKSLKANINGIIATL